MEHVSLWSRKNGEKQEDIRKKKGKELSKSGFWGGCIKLINKHSYIDVNILKHALNAV